MSVNLSMRQLQQPDLVPDVAGALDASGLDPADLMLELTESVLALDDPATAQRLRELHALGVHLAVDDFGTGRSALAYLRQLPVDTLKLAKPFVDGLTMGAEQAALAHAIVRLADTLRLGVVAEGIEQEAQARELRAAGCPTGRATCSPGRWTSSRSRRCWRPSGSGGPRRARAGVPPARSRPAAEGLRQALGGDLEEPCWRRSPGWACRQPQA
jgi:predicted signal transduction protein with EAL and GGDEF domain